MKIASFFFLVFFVITSPASAQSRKPSSIADLAVYRGPDREQILYAGAKAEGKIIWYTSLAGDSYKEMVKAFETRYSGVKVESYRAAGAELVTRLEEEGKARRNIADTIVLWLAMKQHGFYVPRDELPEPSPGRVWTKPLVVLMAESSFSNAEKTPPGCLESSSQAGMTNRTYTCYPPVLRASSANRSPRSWKLEN